jgi:hypothetical protein
LGSFVHGGGCEVLPILEDATSMSRIQVIDQLMPVILNSHGQQNQAHSLAESGPDFVLGASGQERLPNRFPREPVPVSGSASFLAKLVVQPLNFTASTKTFEADEPVPTLTP